MAIATTAVSKYHFRFPLFFTIIVALIAPVKLHFSKVNGIETGHMKRIFALLALSMFSLQVVNAQTQYERLRFGLQFTPNFSWASPQNRLVNAESAGFGFSYGLMAEYKLTENYMFHSGLSITQLSHFVSMDSNTYRNTGTPSGQQKIYDVNYSYRAQYLEIPLAIKMRTNQMGAVRFYGIFGLETGILLQAKAKIKNGSPLFDADEFFFVNRSEDEVIPTVTSNDDLAALRMGILMGVGVEYLVSGNTHVVAGLRFNNPFSEHFGGPEMSARAPYMGLQLGLFF